MTLIDNGITELIIGVEVVHIFGSGLMFTIVKYYRLNILHALMPEAKGCGREEQPHARGQGQWPGGPTPRPRIRGCAGAGGPRGAIPR